MTHQQDASPQLHIDAIYRLTDHLLTQFPDRFNAETDQRVTDIVQSFRLFCENNPKEHRRLVRLLEDQPLERNFITAQCVILQVFARRVETLARQENCPLISTAVDQLYEELLDVYKEFFRHPVPCDGL